jgi:hypothetical protein
VNDELKAAAERLVSREPILDVYCPRKPGEQWTHHASQIAYGLRTQDQVTLANWAAPLLDGTAIDEAWFASEFAEREPGPYVRWKGLHFEVACGIYIGVHEDALLICGCHVCETTATRGQLRLLALALGIELKE